MSRQDDFTGDERRALEAWTALEPPDDLADRVLGALEDEAETSFGVSDEDGARHEEGARNGEGAPGEDVGARLRRRSLWIPISAAAVLLIAAVVARNATRPGPAGHHRFLTRTTLALADRAVVVGEAGTALSWRLEGRALFARQTLGNAFYRVEHGRPFRVETPAGTGRGARNLFPSGGFGHEGMEGRIGRCRKRYGVDGGGDGHGVRGQGEGSYDGG